jgi:tRNA wybutosine-synthesizing protein 4
VDYHEVVDKKIQTVLKNEVLWRRIWPNLEEIKPESAEKYQVNTPGYKLFAGDIRQTEALGERLKALGLDPAAPTLIISECVLIYLKPDESRGILSYLRDFLTGDIALMGYEMINPSDAFGRMMLENLEVSTYDLIAEGSGLPTAGDP